MTLKCPKNNQYQRRIYNLLITADKQIRIIRKVIFLKIIQMELLS